MRRESKGSGLRFGLLAVGAVAASVLVATTQGCGGIDKQFATNASRFVNQSVGPEYEAYVIADPDLTDEQKDIRLQNVAAFRAVVAEALTE